MAYAYLLGKKSTIFMVVCLCSLWIPLLPAASCVGGFKESASAYRKCRSCMVLLQELQSKVHMCIIYLVENVMIFNTRHLTRENAKPQDYRSWLVEQLGALGPILHCIIILYKNSHSQHIFTRAIIVHHESD